jgi:hypothetical protein
MDACSNARAEWRNPKTNEIQTVPRHKEISDVLVRKICRKLSVPER